jgi:hypothetical protein
VVDVEAYRVAFALVVEEHHTILGTCTGSGRADIEHSKLGPMAFPYADALALALALAFGAESVQEAQALAKRARCEDAAPGEGLTVQQTALHSDHLGNGVQFHLAFVASIGVNAGHFGRYFVEVGRGHLGRTVCMNEQARMKGRGWMDPDVMMMAAMAGGRFALKVMMYRMRARMKQEQMLDS